ncbi:hypothetical protein CRE_23275 [Caenorhabditis remanei]|uniref:F-box domain-containing protein n=1 Tax=Caenorhabditis remanei TaxID=31234 RepID=E3NUL6_CAERE|nr:hypothetical protein CRE_23275 [Caenorhabditis remanei]
MNNQKPFPILRLPFLAIEEVFKAMDPFEIINFSMTSKRAKKITKKMAFYSKYSVQLCVDKKMGISINGTDELVSCLYVTTSDTQMDGKTEEDCKSVILGSNWISVEEWNSFFKKWIAMETNLNLECLQLSRKHLETFRALVLHDIPHEVVDEGVKRILKTVRNRSTVVNGGIDIRRIDGKTATFFVRSPGWTRNIWMCIH